MVYADQTDAQSHLANRRKNRTLTVLRGRICERERLVYVRMYGSGHISRGWANERETINYIFFKARTVCSHTHTFDAFSVLSSWRVRMFSAAPARSRDRAQRTAEENNIQSTHIPSAHSRRSLHF